MKRRAKPSVAFASRFELALQQLSVDFLDSAEVKHAATKGSEREEPVRQFFRDRLPETFRVATGEVVDRFDNRSPQLDVMIYDGLRNYAFRSGASIVLPSEALLVSIEVKSVLTRAELVRSFEAARQLRRLRPFGRKPIVTRRFAPRKASCRYFHCLFAYRSDLSEQDWAAAESARIREVVTEMRIQPWSIERIYVAHRGLLYPGEDMAVPEERNEGYGLMHFYMHIVNFLLRENNVRKPVPLMDYAGRLTRGWVHTS